MTFRENVPPIWLSKIPTLLPDGHKYERGCAVVFGGGEMTGAARLAAAASMRIGAGLCVLSAPKAAVPIYRSSVPAHIIVEQYKSGRDTLSDERRNAVLIGPGLGFGKKTMVLDAIHSGRSVVIDADAITQFEDEPQRLLKTMPPHCVLTPHEGEFTRLFPDLTKGDRAERAAEAAKRAGCVIVLKGAGTVIAAPNVEPVVNTLEAPMLATAGSGDVLAGMITGLLAQRMEPFSAACAAVYMHSMAGRMFGPGLVASDMPEMIPMVLRDLYIK